MIKPLGNRLKSDHPDEPMESPNLRLLSPHFSDEQHGAYVDRLIDAFQAGARNVALAGAYSAGKSSVLLGLKNVLLDHKVVEVSLTNLNRSEAELSEAHGEATLSAVLQKEVVKRLLYSADPAELPLSRFNRIRPFRFLRALPSASALALGLLIGFYLFNTPEHVIQFLQIAEAEARTWVVRFLGITAVILFGRWAFHGFRLRELSVGPARLQLSEEGSTYFDEYLDELVYFFQRTGTSIVIFEDLDRFNDPGIFQSLRDLNNVLNGTASIRQSVVFVYAVRDSLFERTYENVESNGPTGEKVGKDRAADERARIGVSSAASDRAKFFDLIVPIVPFISHEVASDLLLDALGDLPEKDQPSTDLVALGGRYYTDMRLIHSIRNEFIVFTEALLEKSNIDGLTADGLFAMVLYKHSHLEDFERIRVGESKLDQLVSLVGDLTSERLSVLDRDIAETSNDLEAAKTAGQRSIEAGERLLSVMDFFLQFSRYGATSIQNITHAGREFGRTDIAGLEFWEKVAEHTGNVTVKLASGHSLQIPSDQLVSMVGVDQPVESWLKTDVRDLTARLRQLRSARRALLTASFTEKISTNRMNGPGLHGNTIAIRDSVRALVGDELAFEMVVNGYIDHNFALYTTQYYGGFVSSRARSFMLQAIDRHRSEPLFPLLKEDVQVLLARVKTGFLGTPSALNVAVFDTLLGDSRLNSTLERIAAGTLDGDASFIATYLTSGAHPNEVVRHLAPMWRHVLDVIGESDRLAKEAKRKYLSIALANLSPNLSYTVSDTTRDFLRQVVDGMPVLAEALDSQASEAVARVLGENGVIVSDLRKVNEQTRKQLALRRAFKITPDNLTALAPQSGGIGLDSIADFGLEIRDYVVDEAPLYLQALNASVPPALSLDDPQRMVEMLEAVADLEADLLTELIRRASKDAILTDIQSAPKQTWRSLARNNRFRPTVENLHAYLEGPGATELDEGLVIFLESIDAIEVGEGASEAEKMRVATFIVNGAGLKADRKVKLVESLQLEDYLDVQELKVGDGNLVGDLISGGHIPDTAQTFNHFRTLEWTSRERAIAGSVHFHSFVPEVDFSKSDLEALIQSTRIPGGIKKAVLDNVERLRGILTGVGSTALVEFALNEGVELSFQQIEALVAARASSSAVARLIGNCGTHLSRDEIVAVLRSLKEPFNKLSAPNGTRPKLPDGEEIRKLLKRLISLNLVSQFREDLPGSVQVFMKRQLT